MNCTATQRKHYKRRLRVSARSGSYVSAQRYQFDNHLGSASLELDESASIISYEEYYPYGDTSYQAGRSASEVSRKRYRYTGKEKDEESGLYYHGARYYACWLGRWTAADPIGVGDGVNLYAYCSGNPVKLLDPEGEEGAFSYTYLPKESEPSNIIRQELENAWNYVTDKLGISQQTEGQFDGKYNQIPILGGIIDDVTTSFIRTNRQHIIDVAKKHEIDPVSIAGAIAWELQNNIGGWASDFLQIPLAYFGLLDESEGVGWGSMHFNVAKKVEEQKFLDRPNKMLEIIPFVNPATLPSATIASLVGRDVGGIFRLSMNLMNPSNAISYIGAHMAHNAEIYKKYGFDISSPGLATTVYHTGKAEESASRRANENVLLPLEERTKPEVPKGNMHKYMGEWVEYHESVIRKLLKD